MKIAFYIEDGLAQVVLTGESETEHRILAVLHESNFVASIKRGSFYETRGGWIRQSSDHDSAIIMLRPTEIQEIDDLTSPPPAKPETP